MKQAIITQKISKQKKKKKRKNSASQYQKLRINKFFKKTRDNYTLPTCGLPLILSAYPWFEF